MNEQHCFSGAVKKIELLGSLHTSVSIINWIILSLLIANKMLKRFYLCNNNLFYILKYEKKKNLKNQKKERSNIYLIYLREKKSLNEDLYSFYKEQRRSNKQPLLYHMDQNNIKIRAKDKIITLNKHKKINLRILQDVFIHYKYRIK